MQWKRSVHARLLHNAHNRSRSSQTQLPQIFFARFNQNRKQSCTENKIISFIFFVVFFPIKTNENEQWTKIDRNRLFVHLPFCVVIFAGGTVPFRFDALFVECRIGAT